MNIPEASQACSALLNALKAAQLNDSEDSLGNQRESIRNAFKAVSKALGAEIGGIQFTTDSGQTHSYTLEGASAHLQQWEEHWPGGLSEIESAIQTAQEMGSQQVERKQ